MGIRGISNIKLIRNKSVSTDIATAAVVVKPADNPVRQLLSSLSQLSMMNSEIDEENQIIDVLARSEARKLVDNFNLANSLRPQPGHEDDGTILQLKPFTDRDGKLCSLVLSVNGEYEPEYSPELLIEFMNPKNRDVNLSFVISNAYTPDGSYIDDYQTVNSDTFVVRAEGVNSDFFRIAEEFYRGLKNSEGKLRITKRRK